MTGLAADYRGTSPLGHHGESENYFTLFDNHLAFDHKHKAAYNDLIYLLVDAGDVVKDGLSAWKESGRGPGHFPQKVRWTDETEATQRADPNEFIRPRRPTVSPSTSRSLPSAASTASTSSTRYPRSSA